MKIFYLITKSGRGGAQVNVLSLVREARRRGFDVTVATGDKGWLTDRVTAEGAETVCLRGFRRSWNPASVPFLVNELRSELNGRRPDILHMHSSNALFGVLATNSTGTASPRTIATVHGLSVLHPGWEGSVAKRVAYRETVRHLWSKCDRVVFVCRSDLEFAERNGLVDTEHASVIHNGLAAPHDFLDVHEARERLGVPRRGSSLPVIGTIARLSAEKDLDLFLDTARLMIGDRCTFRIVGGGPEEFRLVRKIHERGLDGKVAVVHSHGDAYRIARGFDVFLMTSKYEGLPYTLLEAAHAGVPVVAVSIGGVPEVIIDGETGLLVHERDASELAGAVRRLLDESELAKRVSGAARARAELVFTENDMADKTLDIYQTILQHETA
ncbi:MAG: glycosyltransferase [Patescibacteria group bacterium]|nr:glycosyltransferase [Patescibacteria group bacterium]